MNSNNTLPLRPIRSFVLRQGRITAGQQSAFENLWPVLGLENDCALDQMTVFGRKAPLILEIGFGNGESLAKMAAASPEKDFIGIEVHRPGVGHLLLKCQELELQNVRVYCADAVEVLNHCIPDESLSGMQIFFPDPWHKKRHQKRRLISEDFVRLVSSKLIQGGFLHCATDWQDYAEQMLAVLENAEALKNTAGIHQYSERPDHRPLTKFENRGKKLGHGVWDLIFTKGS